MERHEISVTVYYGSEDGIPTDVEPLKPWKVADHEVDPDIGWFWKSMDGMDEYVMGPFPTERHASSHAVHTWALARRLSSGAVGNRKVFVLIDRTGFRPSWWVRDMVAKWRAWRDSRAEGV